MGLTIRIIALAAGGGLAKGRRATIIVLLVALVSSSGCTASRWVTVRPKPKPPVLERLKLLSPSPIEPGPRTMQLLRRYDLAERVGDPPRHILAAMHQISVREPRAENIFATAEVAYLNAKRIEHSDQAEALSLYGTAVSHAYVYLFDDRCRGLSNPYDPQFRGACDVYNGALEGILRLLQERGQLAGKSKHKLSSGPGGMDVEVVTKSHSWKLDDFERFEFASDYQIVGLRNHYRQFGLGVPLIAVRRHKEISSPHENYYPPNLTLPVTVFLRLVPDKSSSGGRRAILEFQDPLEKTSIDVAAMRVPMESDLSTPLAFFLNAPELDDYRVSTRNLFNPIAPDELKGLFMLEPYRPGKIPVLMVHGFWSTPVSWMEMFNDLRGIPEIRDNFQFWFYMYPTGQPFWASATQLRRDLAVAQRQLDPHQADPAMQQMVLVGHSMGGLVSRMQTIESGDEFWKLVSRKPLDQLRTTQQVRSVLANTFYFRPNPSIRRVVTIATPHKGSDIANTVTRWLGQKLINLPEHFMGAKQRLIRENPDVFFEGSLIECQTSVDSLAPTSPALAAMWNARRPSHVRYHNIVATDKFLAKATRSVAKPADLEGDGVVSFTSARTWDATSEIIVEAKHVDVQENPRTILEVRRILLKHLREVRQPRWQKKQGDNTATMDRRGWHR